MDILTMVAWSFLCFVLGAAMHAALHWYRVRLAIKRADQKMQEIARQAAIAAQKGGRRSTDKPQEPS